MNRRSFVLTATAGLALATNSALAQRRGSSASTVLTSELTGGEVDFSGSSLEFNNQHIEQSDGSEHFHFVVGDGGQFDVIIWPQASGDAGEFAQSQADLFFSLSPNAEMIDSDTFEDGGWLAFDMGNIAYYEYQLGAYPGHDLVILFNANPESFADLFDQAQQVLIDGLPPFLFSEESDIVAVAAARVSTSASTTNSGNDRISRRTSTGEASVTGETENSGSSSRTSTIGGDPVEAVRSHRDTFLDSYDEFYTLLENAADETTPSQEVEQAFSEMVSLSQEWQQYPTEAAQVQFGPEHAELESIYLDWADHIGELGIAFEDFYRGFGSVDDFVDVYDAWNIVDAQLIAALRTVGHRFQRQAKARTASENALRAAAIHL